MDKMYNEQVVGDDRALSMHMRSHDKVQGDYNVKNNSSSTISGVNEEGKLANSLVLLSNGSLKPFTLLIKPGSQASIDGNRQLVEKPFLEQANNHGGNNKEGEKDVVDGDGKDNEVVRGTFECRACNKVFYSHQALGGHRASHKKIKGCFAAAYLNPDENRTTESSDRQNPGVSTKDIHGEFLNLGPSKTSPQRVMLHGSLSTNTTSKKISKSHECSICHRVFPSGQALGGHKRCHWLPSNASSDTSIYGASNFQNFLDEGQPPYKKTKFDTSNNSKSLDLNLLPLSFDELYRTPNDNIRLDVGSHIHGFRASVTRNLLKDREVGRDINSIYHSLCLYNSTHENYYSTKGKDSDVDAKGKCVSIQLKNLKDNTMNGLHSSWLKLGIGSS